MAIIYEQFRQNIGDSCHPLIHNLLQMDSRIRLHETYGDVVDDKGFFLTKEFIHIPYELPSIEHEIAHMVEMKNPKRWIMSDWGMNTIKIYSANTNSVFSALAREVRTRAIQLHITNFANESEKLYSTAYNIFNNTYWLDEVKRRLPFGRFTTIKDVENWVNDIRERTYRSWDLGRILQEWKTRLDYIQNWMETS